MHILPFQKEHIPQAAALFVHSFKTLRRSQSLLPDLMEDRQRVSEKLDQLVNASCGVVAVEDGIVIGYLGWFLVDGFRGTDRRGAYCPEWGHSAADVARPVIYNALCRAASVQWAAARCGVYAITLLAHDREISDTWFWNGFGLAVVDAIRALQPVSETMPDGYRVRRANLDDIETLVALETEHWQHYSLPPVSMVPQPPPDSDDCTAFFREPVNNYWLAEQDGGEIMGFMRFEGNSFGAAEIVSARTTIAITGAYVWPAHRGRRVAVELLDASLRYYAGRGFARCSVDFEAFNPEARGLWLKYFEPVCFSLMRVPECVQPDP
jgi:ribosomal protein S18 acetylase RimI-like enzyme